MINRPVHRVSRRLIPRSTEALHRYQPARFPTARSARCRPSSHPPRTSRPGRKRSRPDFQHEADLYNAEVEALNTLLAQLRAKLPRQLSEKISLAAQGWIGCGTCMAAHVAAARAAGLGDTDIALAREATATDPREAALLTFAVRVLAEPASITADDITELRTHGWNDRTIADVVGLVNLNLLTGSFNLVAGIQPEED